MDVDILDYSTSSYNRLSTCNIQPHEMNGRDAISSNETESISSQISSKDFTFLREEESNTRERGSCIYTYKAALLEFMKNIGLIVALLLSFMAIYDRLLYLLNTLLRICGVLISAYIMFLFKSNWDMEECKISNPILIPVFESNEKCLICWEGAELHQTVCGHIFHDDCLWDWLNCRKGTQLCPCCKADNIF